MSLMPVVDVKEWAERYKIKIDPIKCPSCKETFELDTPIALPKYRGLTISDHGCGPNMPFRVVPIGKEEIDKWNQLLG